MVKLILKVSAAVALLTLFAPVITVLCRSSEDPATPKPAVVPLTGVKVVDTIVTEMAYMRVTPLGLALEEIAPGLSAEDVQHATQATLIISPNLRIMPS